MTPEISDRWTGGHPGRPRICARTVSWRRIDAGCPSRPGSIGELVTIEESRLTMIRRVAFALLVGGLAGAVGLGPGPRPRPRQPRRRRPRRTLFPPIPTDPAAPGLPRGGPAVDRPPQPPAPPDLVSARTTRTRPRVLDPARAGSRTRAGWAGTPSITTRTPRGRRSTSTRSRSAGSTAAAGPTAPSRSPRPRPGSSGPGTSRTTSTPMGAPTGPTGPGFGYGLGLSGGPALQLPELSPTSGPDLIERRRAGAMIAPARSDPSGSASPATVTPPRPPPGSWPSG